MQKSVSEVDRVAVRFAGDSGDGMQLTGSKFTDETAQAGNDLSTFPDFPAEIRAPAGTLAGVSGFQLHFASRRVHTPADQVDLLVAFNPAALRANIDDVRPQGMVIVNSDAFSDKALIRAGYEPGEDPLTDLADRYNLVPVPLTTLNRKAAEGSSLSHRDTDRCKNFFALGLMCWLYHRPMKTTERWLETKFQGAVLEANIHALRTGHAYGETAELFPVSYSVPAAKIEPGVYRNITGNTAIAWGIIAASVQLDRPVFMGAYPITPASDILHELARHRNFGLRTFQAEDEIAAMSASIGAAFAGKLAVTATSGPGFVLKQEALGLASMVELPVVVIDVQRAGPSTGSPTKTEQGDLLTALYGRNSPAPLPVLAPCSPGDCFYTMREAFELAIDHMTPVVVLSDSYLANSAEPWKIPDVETLTKKPVAFAKPREDFQPYERNPETLARPWAIPGTPSLEHRLGGLTKANISGDVVYDPGNHEEMMALRADKVARIANHIPGVEVVGPEEGKLLVVGWGSTLGTIVAAVEEARERGISVSRTHIRYLNPFPPNLESVLSRFENILLPELNNGQLSMLLRAKFLLPVQPFTKVSGQPFKVSEIVDKIQEIAGGEE